MSPIEPKKRPFHPLEEIGCTRWDGPWGWTNDQAATIATIPPKQVAYWVEAELFQPSVFAPDEPGVLFSLGDVVMLRLLREMLDASIEPWTAAASVENFAADYTPLPEDRGDWAQPAYLNVHALATGTDWFVVPVDLPTLQAIHDPNKPGGYLVDPEDVEGDGWEKGPGRFRIKPGDVPLWAWPIAHASKEVLEHRELWCRRHNKPLTHLGKWM